MRCFLKHLKGIAYFLAVLMLFQSCIVIYNKSSIAEASRYYNHRITVKTVDGEKYKLPWVEEINENVVSVLNTERVFLDANEVKQIVKYHPNPQVIPLDSAERYSGTISVQTQDARGKYESHEFIKFEKQGDLYRCYKMTGQDTLTVVIPLAQVEKTKVVSNEATIGVSLLVGIAVLVGIGAWAVSNMEISMNFSD